MGKGNRERGAAMAHLIEQFGVPVVGVDGHDACADGIEREQMDEVVGCVLNQ